MSLSNEMMTQRLLTLCDRCKGGVKKLVLKTKKQITSQRHPHSALAYSNIDDIRRWGFKKEKYRHTPWHWGSNWVLEKANIKAGQKFLDLGCVDNPYVLDFCRKRVDIEAVFLDLSDPPPANAMPPHIKYLQHDLTQKIPFEDESFDAVISESSLEHLPVEGRLLCLKEACRVLKPSGRLALSLGYVIGLNTEEKVRLIATNEFFTKRHCAVFAPVDIRLIVNIIAEAIQGETLHPDRACFFPGFDGFSENLLLQNPKIIIDRFSEHPGVPDLLKDAASLEFGIFFSKRVYPRRPVGEKS